MAHHEHPHQKQRGRRLEAKVLRLEVDSREDFSETCRLLEEKLLNYVRLNSRLRNNVTSRYNLVEVLENGIHVNLTAFNSDYQAKFILADMPEYCRRLMQQLEPVLMDYLRECKIVEYTFRYTFHHNGNTLERYAHLTSITV